MDDRHQAAEAIRQTLTRVKQFLAQEAPPRLSEADTKANFIERYISALGYEGLEDVVREYYVKNSQEFIDFVLRANGEPVTSTDGVDASEPAGTTEDPGAATSAPGTAPEGEEPVSGSSEQPAETTAPATSAPASTTTTSTTGAESTVPG